MRILPTNLDIRYQTIEEVQSDIGDIDSNSENISAANSQRTSGASLNQGILANQIAIQANGGSAIRLRSRPVLQEKNVSEQTPNVKSSIIKKINFSHGKNGTGKKKIQNQNVL